MGSQWGYGCPSEEPNCDLQVYDPTEGDNILNGPWEPLTLVEGDGNESAGEWVELKKLSGEYIPFGECKTYYIGVAWCVGTMSIGPSPLCTMTCDGSTAGNITQSDSYVSDSIFEVVAASNNDPSNPFKGM
jgi:hypothetical protein